MELRDKIKIKSIEVKMTAESWGVQYQSFADGLNREVELCIYYGFSANEAYQYLRQYIDTIDLTAAEYRTVLSVATDALAVLYGEDAAFDAATNYR